MTLHLTDDDSKYVYYYACSTYKEMCSLKKITCTIAIETSLKRC
jgi:hypothetical protein